MPETILVEREGRVAILTINRPDKMNALNDQVRNDMLEILGQIETDASVGVVESSLDQLIPIEFRAAPIQGSSQPCRS